MKNFLMKVTMLVFAFCMCFCVALIIGCTPEHVHEFNQKSINDEYKISDATCTEKEKYYYSCKCGEKGEKTFEIGGLGHCVFDIVANFNGTHTKVCENNSSHNIIEKCYGEIICGEKVVCSLCKTEFGDVIRHEYEFGKCKYCQDIKPSEGLEFKLINNDTEYALVGTGSCYDDNIVIPSLFNGKSVTRIEVTRYYRVPEYITIPVSVVSIDIKYSGWYSKFNINYLGTAEEWAQIRFDFLENRDGRQYNYDLYLNGTLATSIELSTMTIIPNYAFAGCSSLIEVKIGEKATSIGEYAFFNCDNLTSIKLNDNIDCIDDYSLFNCDKLERVELPKNIETIGDYVLFDCDALENIEIPNSVKSIGGHALLNCDVLECNVKQGIKYLGNAENPYLYMVGFAADEIELAIDINCKFICADAFKDSSATRLKIPDGITVISKYFFTNCKLIESVEIPESVIRIEERAFMGCFSLKEINLPSSLEYIGEYAFANCINLSYIEIPNCVTQIGNNAFYNCPSLERVKLSNELTRIEEGTFRTCEKLTSIEIQNKVSYIGKNAFYWNTSLENIVFNGTISEWCAITKEEGWNYNIPATFVQCTDGKVNI